MSNEIAISLKNVSKCFNRYDRPVDRLKEILLPVKSKANEFWALRDISLEIPTGQTVGIVGQNGSGKSTLLQVIAGILTPTMGEVQVHGRVSALLELGSGFNPEFTGRQNVFFNGRLLGLSQKEVEDKFDEIAGFADIGSFLEQPVKTYSSGMFVRLAFAVAINVNPDILIVDEALSVGDGIFVHRCMAKIKEFRDSKGTILFVSHDTGAINRLCSSCVWINDGHLIEQGHPIDVSKSYQIWTYNKINDGIKKQSERSNNTRPDNLSDPLDSALEPKTANVNPFTAREFFIRRNVKRFGTGRCEIISLEVLNEEGRKVGFVMPGETLILRTKIISHDNTEKPILGIMMFDRLRVAIAGWNTAQYGHQLPKLNRGEVIHVNFEIKWPDIKSDTYSLEPAIADGSQENHEMMDWIQAFTAIDSGVTDLTFGFIRFANVSVSHEMSTFVEEPNPSRALSK